MSSKVATLDEPLVTVLKLANVWLLSSMGSVMSSEIEVKRESRTTYITFEWLFTLNY